MASSFCSLGLDGCAFGSGESRLVMCKTRKIVFCIYAMALSLVAGMSRRSSADEQPQLEQAVKAHLRDFSDREEAGFGRSAVFGQCESFSFRQSKLKHRKFYIFFHSSSVSDAEQLHFWVSVSPPQLSSKQLQDWNERVVFKSRQLVRQGAATRGYSYVAKQDHETMRDFFERANYEPRLIDPMSFVFAYPSLLFDRRLSFSPLRSHFQRFYRYSHAVRLKNGDIRSHWTSDAGDMRNKITLIQSKAHDFMPVLLRREDSGQPGGIRDLFMETRVVWETVQNRLVPVRMDFVEELLGQRLQRAMVLDWTFDAEVPDYLFESEWADHREKLEQFTGFSIDRSKPNGVMMPAEPYEPPEELTRASERRSKTWQ